MLLILSILILPLIKVDAILIEESVFVVNGGGGGSGYVPPDVPDPEVSDWGTAPAGLNANFTFNKNAYDPNETIGVTTSLYYNACGNSTQNLVARGYIGSLDYTGPWQNMFENTVIEGQQTIFRYSSFTAPANAWDSYYLNVEIKGYNVNLYKLSDSLRLNDSSLGTEFTNLGDFQNFILDYIYQHYPSRYNEVVGGVSFAETFEELSTALVPISNLSVSLYSRT